MNTTIIPPAPNSDLNLYISASASWWVWVAGAIVVGACIFALVSWLTDKTEEKK